MVNMDAVGRCRGPLFSTLKVQVRDPRVQLQRIGQSAGSLIPDIVTCRVASPVSTNAVARCRDLWLRTLKIQVRDPRVHLEQFGQGLGSLVPNLVCCKMLTRSLRTMLRVAALRGYAP